MAVFPVTLSDSCQPQTTPFSTYNITFHISIVDGGLFIRYCGRGSAYFWTSPCIGPVH